MGNTPEAAGGVAVFGEGGGGQGELEEEFPEERRQVTAELEFQNPLVGQQGQGFLEVLEGELRGG